MQEQAHPQARAVLPDDADELLDESAGFLGLGRSLTFPFPQRRAHDRYRTVYFDEGTGPTVVYVHGMGGNATHIELLARPLVERYRVIGLDLAGMGWNRKPVQDYTIDLLCDHLLDFLDQRGVAEAAFIGHSFGGAVCIEAALRRPSLVQAMVLLCPVGIVPMPRWMQLLGPLLLDERLLFPLLAKGSEYVVKRAFHQRPETNPHVRWFCDSSLRDEPGYPNLREFARVIVTCLRDLLTRDCSRQLPRLRVPALTIWGDHDQLTVGSSAVRALSRVPRLRSVTVKDCGHMPMVEHPEETLDHVERFFREALPDRP